MSTLDANRPDAKAPEHDQIIQAAREIAQPLSMPPASFQRVLWIKHFPSDRCGFRTDTVFLSQNMIGRLEPEEWKPLLASYLIHKRTRRKGLLPTALLTALEYIVILFVGIGLIATVFGRNGGVIALGYFLVTFSIFSVNRSTQDTKKRKLRADIEATKIVDREKFLQTLRKIDSFRMKDVERAKKSGLLSNFSTRPSITARISNLVAEVDSSSYSKNESA